MRLGDLFGRKRPEPEAMEDACFGSIRADRHGIWAGSVPFTPAGRKVDVAIKAGPDGPSEDQRRFFQEIERRYPALASELRETMFEDVEPWPDGTTGPQIFDSLELQLIGIYSDQPPFTWELALTTPLDGHIFIVHMRDWQYEGYGMDG